MELPGELKTQIRSAAQEADLDRILELINRIELEWPQTASQLRNLAQHLQYKRFD